MVRSMSKLGLVGVGGCGRWVMRGGTVGGVVRCVWSWVGLAVSAAWLDGGGVQWRGVRAAISDLSSAGGEGVAVVGGGWGLGKAMSGAGVVRMGGGEAGVEGP